MDATKIFTVSTEDAGSRLDRFLTAKLADVSRARVQRLIEQQQVSTNGKNEKSSFRLQTGDNVSVTGEVQLPPLRATAEDIPLDIIYEDNSIAVVNKPAGMMVHAGAGAHHTARNRGTLVNALLHHFRKLSALGGELRPGIVHRLDKETSGLILVAKTDAAHRKLAEQFSLRKVKKEYIALVHGWPKQESGTVSSAIGRDRVRRTRMTARARGGREAVTHYKALERIDSLWGKFSLFQVQIETGRTHQIRVHLASLGHPVVGDTLYGAPRQLRSATRNQPALKPPAPLSRNFLHAARITIAHPRSGKLLSFYAPLPEQLQQFLAGLRCATARP